MLGGIQCFQIYGELFHLQGPLQDEDHTSAQFAQLYFYDPQQYVRLKTGCKLSSRLETKGSRPFEPKLELLLAR